LMAAGQVKCGGHQKEVRRHLKRIPKERQLANRGRRDLTGGGGEGDATGAADAADLNLAPLDWKLARAGPRRVKTTQLSKHNNLIFLPFVS
jgi:hypothetical protein